VERERIQAGGGGSRCALGREAVGDDEPLRCPRCSTLAHPASAWELSL